MRKAAEQRLSSSPRVVFPSPRSILYLKAANAAKKIFSSFFFVCDVFGCSCQKFGGTEREREGWGGVYKNTRIFFFGKKIHEKSNDKEAKSSRADKLPLVNYGSEDTEDTLKVENQGLVTAFKARVY